jgi:hypothetical protein
MKKLIYIFLFILTLGMLISCSELTFGDAFLNNQPESSGATLDTMFNSMLNSDKVLANAYRFLPYGLPTGSGAGYNKLGVNLLEGITDLYQSFRDNISDGPINLYYNGALSANINPVQQGSEAYRFGSQVEYNAIRYAWLYIENAEKIPDMTIAQKNERIAEAKVIIALSYAEMLRYVGGLPWIDHAVSPNEEMYFPRNTFEETVNKIVALLDEAIPHLPWQQPDNDNGRMTKAGAMALKLRVLLFAASPTFNSNSPWHADADEYTRYTNADPSRWQRAMQAGEEFMSELRRQGVYALVQPIEDTHLARREAFRSGYYDRGSSEILISTRRGYDAATVHSNVYGQRYYSGPTLNYVNMFPWSDGSEFPENFNWQKPPREPFFNNGAPTRDPRLYETVVVPGDIWFNGTYAPVYVNHPTYRPGSGFAMMKFILRENSDRVNKPAHWPYLRLPEVLLSYAEAINECNNGPNTIAYECVNQVRERVGLSPLPSGMSKIAFREALLKERALEFGFEEVRWFDLVRWGREQDFRKQLYGLSSKADNQNMPKSFIFSTYEISNRFWVTNWDTKWYLAPIPQSEINKKYGMTQNPGW